MKILLIEPNHKDMSKSLPLGIAYLASTLRNNNYNVLALDANLDELDYKGVFNAIKDKDIDVCGISATTAQIKEAWRILKYLKKKRPNVISILGGVHPTALPEESLNKPYVDFILRGECDFSILQFIKAIKDKKYCNVDGLSFKKAVNGKIKFFHNKKLSLIEDVDKIPFPARDLFKGFPEKYSSSIQHFKRNADILTSRGCPGTCYFCNKNIHGHRFRARSPENVLNEIEYLYWVYGINHFHILDDYFTSDSERVNKICDLILERNLKIEWVCASGIRVDNISLELLKKMREAGCYRTVFGVESGSNEILKKIGKNINLKQIKRAFNLAQEAGIQTVASFMIGNIYETKETINQTIEFAKSLKTDYAQFCIAIPYPNTALHKLISMHKFGSKFITKDWDKYEPLGSSAIYVTEELSEELLNKSWKKAYNSFYFRPKQILFIIYKQIKSGKFNFIQLFGLVNHYMNNFIKSN